MATPDLEMEVKSLKDEVKGIIQKNNDLVQKVQFWKMKAGQQETEKLELVKENNELRLKLSRLRSAGAAQARALDVALQAASEEALSHLVQASGAITQTIKLTKSYMSQREELETEVPRWSKLSSTPIKDKVNKVLPMMMGGRSIQPFVSLNRVPMNNSLSGASRSPNQNRIVSARVLPLPVHMLQDVYIPLRRIDTSEFTNNASPEMEPEVDMPEDNLMLEEEHSMEESQHFSEEEEVEMSRLEILHEESDERQNETTSSPTLPVNRPENPLEGPSWMLDNLDRSRRPKFSMVNVTRRRGKSRVTLEADSTTELDESRSYTPPPAPAPAPDPAPHSPAQSENIPPSLDVSPGVSHAFTPTVRRRKRTSSPPMVLLTAPSPSTCPRAPARTPPLSPLLPMPNRSSNKSHSNKSHSSERVLKVLVPKIPLSVMEGGGPTTPKRPMRFDAPSPNGATDAALIVMEQKQDRTQSNAGGETSSISAQRNTSVAERDGSSVQDIARERDSDSGGETRTRRPRKQVTYKEKPLNRKLRR